MSSNRQITSGQARLAAKVVGDGDPVVFLHAAVCDSRMWRGQLDALGASNKAMAYDRRGFGETRAEKEDFSAVADLLAVIDAVGNGAPTTLLDALRVDGSRSTPRFCIHPLSAPSFS